jgi:hypothetical protein
VDLPSTDADAGDDAVRLISLLALASLAFADGGKVQFQRKAGAFNITLFSTPTPVRAGRADFSVMVQKSGTETPVLDADVRLHLIKREDSIKEVSALARHEQATNKLLYAAQVDLNATGKWRVEISVQTASGSALVTGEIEVLPPVPPLLAHWPYFAVLPVLAILFAFNQVLKRRRVSNRR